MPALTALRWLLLPCVASGGPTLSESSATAASTLATHDSSARCPVEAEEATFLQTVPKGELEKSHDPVAWPGPLSRAVPTAPATDGETRPSPGDLATTVKHIFGARVIVHKALRRVRGTGPISGVPRWGVTFERGCTNKDLKAIRDSLPNGSRPLFEGRPSEGGLCFFELEATEHHVHELLEKRRHWWPSRPTFESVFEWSALPTVELPGGASHAADAGAKGANGSQVDPPSWGLDRIDARGGLDHVYAPARRLDGSGVHVYMLDTGIRSTHMDFGGRAIPTLEVVGRGVVPCAASRAECARDRNGHGTHTAATVGGSAYGVAKGATLHAVQVLNSNGAGPWSWFVAAIDWILANGERPAVISASIGGPGKSHSVTAAVDAAVSAGVTVVVAAGNDGTDACAYTPSGVGSAITVGAMDKDDSRSGYSNTGSCVDVFGPGSGIVSAWASSDTARKKLSGTSMACPHVAGAAALTLQEQPSRGPADVKQAMVQQATSGVLQDVGIGSPNKLLFVGDSSAPQAEPASQRPSAHAA